MLSRSIRVAAISLLAVSTVVACDADTEGPEDVEDDDIQVDDSGPPATDTRGTVAPATLPTGSDVPDTDPLIEPPLTVEE